ncbi:flagellar basal body rod protein [Paucibacter sp. PLA-PC-4]|uniref:flagellar basal body rod protein n=1 Tax=Paucibacter sp. PLA-PC-4 TaxID=2993655 RepID=UPI00224934CD|nr:flagellar basal body rod protein [Paucibacter sp. PLA-PC-4]MCX2861458.1 flagellar basal body rod protein [Paucibacter sp. PLA-PC-4]
MSSVSLSTALSGISAANERLRASAHNTANLQTPGFRPERVVQTSLPEGGVVAGVERSQQVQVSAERELVEQRSATYSYVANLRVLQTQLRAEGALLDIKA